MQWSIWLSGTRSLIKLWMRSYKLVIKTSSNSLLSFKISIWMWLQRSSELFISRTSLMLCGVILGVIGCSKQAVRYHRETLLSSIGQNDSAFPSSQFHNVTLLMKYWKIQDSRIISQCYLKLEDTVYMWDPLIRLKQSWVLFQTVGKSRIHFLRLEII